MQAYVATIKNNSEIPRSVQAQQPVFSVWDKKDRCTTLDWFVFNGNYSLFYEM